MAIDQCADDSAAIRVVELPDGTMRWELIPGDNSIAIGAGVGQGAVVAAGGGLFKHADGRLGWQLQEAARVRTGAGAHTGLTAAHGTVVLQEGRQNIVNTTGYTRHLLVGFCCPWVDIVDVSNASGRIHVYYGFQFGSITVWQLIGQLHTDNPSSNLRRTRGSGGSVIDCAAVPPGGTIQIGMRIDSVAIYGAGSYSTLFDGFRMDAFWLGGPTA